MTPGKALALLASTLRIRAWGKGLLRIFAYAIPGSSMSPV